MSREVSLLLNHHLKQLRLPTMAREYAAVAAVCAQQQSDYATFLLQISERELIERQRKSVEARIKAARFPTIKTLDSFDFTQQPSINQKLINELAIGEYLDKRENILLVGNPGTGKSHLSIALGHAACSQGRKVRFWPVSALITQMLEIREQRTLGRFCQSLEKLDLIILDELGYVPFTKTGAELFFEVVSRAYEKTSLILNTNLPFEQWIEVMGSDRLTGALLDRITHRVHIIEANGQSYRFRHAQKRRKKQS